MGQGSKDNVGFNLDGTTPIVPLINEDPYEGEAKLRFGNKPIPIDKDIPVEHTTKTLPHKEVSYNSVFAPVTPNTEEQKLENLTPKKDIDIQPNKFKEEVKPARRSTRKTRWIPVKAHAMKMTTLGLGMLFLPTHIIAEPGPPGLNLGSNAHQLQNALHAKPLDTNPNLEKLRAYHSFLSLIHI